MLSQNDENDMYSDIQSRTLWIGELDNWMDEKYLIKSLESYGKFILYNPFL